MKHAGFTVASRFWRAITLARSVLLTLTFQTVCGANSGNPADFLPADAGSPSEEPAQTEPVPDYSCFTPVENGDNTLRITGYTGEGGEVSVPEIIDGKRVTVIANRAFSGCTCLTSVTIPDGVTRIGEYAFKGCTELSSVTIPNSVTKINIGTFSGCTRLPSLTIPDSVKSIGNNAFDDCAGLFSVTIPESVTSIGCFAFYHCHKLVHITNLSGQVIKYLPSNLGLEIRTDTSSAFANRLSVDSDGLVTYQVGAAKYAFAYVGASPILDMTGKGVTDLYPEAFRGCTGLSSVTIPDGVKSIGDWAFHGCAGLSSVTIPDSVTSIGDCAFCECTSLNTITVGNSVTSIGDWAFYGCTGLSSVTIPDGVKSISDWAFHGCTGLSSVVIGNGVTSIDEKAFYWCTGLSSVTIPDSVTSIGYEAFYGCTGLSSVTIGNGVTSIGEHAFYGCTELSSVTIPDSVTSIGYEAFLYCTGLSSVTIPDSVTSIDENAFSGCYRLVHITNLSGCELSGIPSNTGLEIRTDTSSSFANTLSVDGDGLVTYQVGVAKYAFSYVGASPTLDLTGKKLDGIYAYAFYGCTGLSSITIPDSVTSISNYEFSGCTNLTSAVFKNPDGWKGETWGKQINVSDAATAAKYLTSTYASERWRRS